MSYTQHPGCITWQGADSPAQAAGACCTSTFLNRRARGGHGFRHWSFLKHLARRAQSELAPLSLGDVSQDHFRRAPSFPGSVGVVFPRLGENSKLPAGKDFQKLTDDEKGIVRVQYFERVIRPYIHSDMIEDARRMFEVEAKLSTSSSITPR